MNYLITFHDKNNILITVHEKYKQIKSQSRFTNIPLSGPHKKYIKGYYGYTKRYEHRHVVIINLSGTLSTPTYRSWEASHVVYVQWRIQDLRIRGAHFFRN